MDLAVFFLPLSCVRKLNLELMEESMDSVSRSMFDVNLSEDMLSGLCFGMTGSCVSVDVKTKKLKFSFSF